MKVTIFGNTDSSKALQQYVEDKLDKEVSKYFDSALNANVYFKKENHKEIRNFHVTIVINEGSKTGVTIKADGQSNDPHLSFDEALHRITKQLKKYKNKLKDFARHSNKEKEMIKAIQAQKYILPHSDEELKHESSSNNNLNILEEKEMEIEHLSVNDAVMKMDLLNLSALVFINQDNGRVNVVYHRKDGNVSWIDPKVN